MSRGLNHPRISSEGLRLHVADALNRVGFGGERVIIERHGKPAAAMIPVADLERLEALEDADDLKAAKAARREKGGVTLAELKTELGL